MPFDRPADVRPGSLQEIGEACVAEGHDLRQLDGGSRRWGRHQRTRAAKSDGGARRERRATRARGFAARGCAHTHRAGMGVCNLRPRLLAGPRREPLVRGRGRAGGATRVGVLSAARRQTARDLDSSNLMSILNASPHTCTHAHTKPLRPPAEGAHRRRRRARVRQRALRLRALLFHRRRRRLDAALPVGDLTILLTFA